MDYNIKFISLAFLYIINIKIYMFFICIYKYKILKYNFFLIRV